MQRSVARVVFLGRPNNDSPRADGTRCSAAVATIDSNRIAGAYTRSELYPANEIWEMFQFLGGIDASGFREFAFYVDNDRMIRKLSFAQREEFARAVREKNPHRIDVGAIYRESPDPSRPLGDAIAREMVFDIDIDAYDGEPRQRFCCSGQSFCKGCWGLVNVAAKIIDSRARAMGQGDACAFYSGGRGIHMRYMRQRRWEFCQTNREIRECLRRLIVPEFASALELAGSAADVEDRLQLRPQMEIVAREFFSWYFGRNPRAAVSALVRSFRATIDHRGRNNRELGELLQIAKGTDATSVEVEMRACREHEARAQIVEKRRERAIDFDFLRDQGEQWRTIVDRLASLRDRCAELFSGDFWSDDGPRGERRLARCAVMGAAIDCLWPRIDTGPSDQPGHLLRAPMGIHQQTGMLGVVVGDLDDFYPPDDQPTIAWRRDGSGVAVGVEFKCKTDRGDFAWAEEFRRIAKNN